MQILNDRGGIIILDKGLVQVYTGEGKGKTTAALGLALRAVGQGLKVYILQFLKSEEKSGEHNAAKSIPEISIEQCGVKGFLNKDKITSHQREKALEGLSRAKKAIMEKEYDMVILDEINVALNYGLIPLEEVLKMIKERPLQVELVLTGRNMPEEIEELADLISEVKMVKHPFAKGIKARRGIEF